MFCKLHRKAFSTLYSPGRVLKTPSIIRDLHKCAAVREKWQNPFSVCGRVLPQNYHHCRTSVHVVSVSLCRSHTFLLQNHNPIFTSHIHCGSVCGKVEYFLGHKVKQPKKDPILKYSEVILIDANNKNLGVMNSRTALGLAEGQGLKVIMVKSNQEKLDREKPFSEKSDRDKTMPIFKVVSSKTLYEQKKAQKREKNKKIPQNIIKEIRISTKIEDHDMETKMRYVRRVLEEGYSLRVIAELRMKGKWLPPDEFNEEKKKKEKLLDSMEERLTGMAVRIKGKSKQIDVVSAVFRPVSTTVTKDQ